MARASRADVPFDAPPGSFGPGRPATEKARHRSAQRAYREGRAGKPMSMDQSEPLSSDELREFYEQGRNARLEREPEPDDAEPDDTAAPAPAPTPAPPAAVVPSRPAARSSSSSTVNDGAGVLLGVFVYALLLNYLQGGTDQARGWLASKFLNKPWTGTRAAPVAPSAPSRPTATPATPANPTRLVTVLGHG
jgi:hypothetical protein